MKASFFTFALLTFFNTFSQLDCSESELTSVNFVTNNISSINSDESTNSGSIDISFSGLPPYQIEIPLENGLTLTTENILENNYSYNIDPFTF